MADEELCEVCGQVDDNCECSPGAAGAGCCPGCGKWECCCHTGADVTLTTQKLTELARLEREAAPAKWRAEGPLPDQDYDIHIGCPPGSGRIIATVGGVERVLVYDGILRHEEAALLVALRNAAPQLLAACERAASLERFLGEHGAALRAALHFTQEHSVPTSERAQRVRDASAALRAVGRG